MPTPCVQTLSCALRESIPPGRFEPITLTLARAYFGTTFIPDWPSEIDLDI